MFMKRGIIGLILLLTLSLITGCDQKATEKELLVSAAASMTESMEAIQKLYSEKYPDTILTINFGSSGSLQQQIEQGSPVDVFISASQSKMNNLEEKNLIVTKSRTNLLENKLVLIAPINNSLINNFKDLSEIEVTNFAIGEPDSVPAGKYAKEALETLGLYNKLSDVTVFAKDVKEVLTWVETNNVDCGIVYETDANTTDKVKIVDIAEEGTYTPIEYPVAIINSSKEKALATEFLAFLETDEVIAIFENYGFHMAN